MLFFSSGCLGWAALFYCGTPWALHIIIFFQDYNQAILLYTDARVEDALDILEKCMEQRRSPGNNQMEQLMLRIYESKLYRHSKSKFPEKVFTSFN